MGKRLLILFFLTGLIIALSLLGRKNPSSLRDNIEKFDINEPRILLKNFESTRYSGNHLIAHISADGGGFFSPNFLELKDNVHGWRTVEGAIQSVYADKALLYFESDSIAQIMSSPKFETGYVKGNVKISFREEILRTDFAKYLSQENVVISDQPVNVSGVRRWFSGQEGFKFLINDEILYIFGTVKGSVTPVSKQN